MPTSTARFDRSDSPLKLPRLPEKLPRRLREDGMELRRPQVQNKESK